MQIKNILFTAILGLSATSCNLLGPVSDIEPDYVLTDENVITNAQSAEYLLNGIYTTYRTRLGQPHGHAAHERYAERLRC